MPGEVERGRSYCWNSSGGVWLKTTFTGCELLKNFKLPFITLKRIEGITACQFITDSSQGTEDES